MTLYCSRNIRGYNYSVRERVLLLDTVNTQASIFAKQCLVLENKCYGLELTCEQVDSTDKLSDAAEYWNTQDNKQNTNGTDMSILID